jgi:acyl-CoA synthetase (AMP-forming)/AMP-acid ligase II
MEHFDPVQCLELIERHKVTIAQFVPTMFTRLLKLPEAERQRHDLSSLKIVMHGAAPCPVSVKQQMLDWWGPIIYEYYAGTEDIGSTNIGPREWLAHPGSVGKPINECPRTIDFTDQLPREPNGKLYKRLLRERYWAGHNSLVI